MDKKQKGKFIVLYAGNNLGKSIQIREIVKILKRYKLKLKTIKYPIYDLKPTGELINDYLRKNNPNKLDPKAFQTLHAANKYQYQPILEKDLKDGWWVIAEDYAGTSLTWGVATGVTLKYLEKINQGLTKPDLEIVLIGKPFDSGHEKGHIHEDDRKLLAEVSKLHEKLASKYSWSKISANQKIPKVTEDIMKIIKNKFHLK